jgi:surfeit locus 1 family protein
MPASPHRRKGLLGPALVTLAAFVVLGALGTWQLERRAWKEALIETLTRRLSAPPIELPLAADWSKLAQEDTEYRRVRFRAEFPAGEEALVYTSGSAFRPDVTGTGYWIMSPARAAGGVIVVNRGFVPEGRQDVNTRAPGQHRGAVDIVGVLRWPEVPGLFTPAGNPQRNLWFARDPVEIARAKNWGPVAPFYVEQEAPVPPGGLPQPGALKVQLPNDHLQYAITWYGLALVLLGVFGFWLRGRERAGS